MNIKKSKGGVRNAANLLSVMPLHNRLKIMEEIAKKDPIMAEKIRNEMVIFEDLQYLTIKMIQDFLKEVNLEDFALALRIGSDSLRKHILNNVSNNMRKDIEEILNGKPMPVSQIEEAQEKIMKLVRKKVENGELVLRKDIDEEYV